MDELAAVLELNHINIAVISETWFKTGAESSGSLDGYNIFTRNRSTRKCGGVAILIHDNIPATFASLETPPELEVLWVTARPKWLPRQASVLAICGVYLPPKSTVLTVQDLTDHLITSIMLLTKKYDNPVFMVMGDFNPKSNPFKAECLTKACKLDQVVRVPTRGNNTLDYIFTNRPDWYKEPTSLPGLGMSDHDAVLWEPLSYQPLKLKSKVRYSRKFPDSRIREFGMWITHHDWEEVISPPCVHLKVHNYQDTLSRKVDFHFPLQKVTQHPTDKAWMTVQIKKQIKWRQKAHAVKDTNLRKQLANSIITKIKQAKANFCKEKISLLHNVSPAKWFNHIRNLTSTKPSDCKLLSIPEVANASDVAHETINNHFSKFSNSIPPLDRDSLACFLPFNKPVINISVMDAYHSLKSLCVSKAPGPGDIPLRLMKEFAPELAIPLGHIYNCSLEQCVVPSLWKNTHVTPIPKLPTPLSLDQLRPISKTPTPGKNLEKIVAKEIWLHIKNKVDPRQFGNIKGSSTVHYLVELMDQVASNADTGLAVTAVTIDLSKAFDLIDHTILVKKMLLLDIPGHLVLWCMSFLTDRQQCTQAFGKLSNPHGLSCGVPQGTVLGPLFFLIMVNDDVDNLAQLYKFVDDKTIAIAHPKNTTPALQSSIDKAVEWTATNNMKINEKKCHVIKFHFSKTLNDSKYFINCSEVSSVNELNLLGVIINKDLKWNTNTDFMITKCNRKIFMFAKLKSFCATRDDLLRVWTSYLRPICEYAAPVWHSSLTDTETSKLERAQKRALRIILGADYTSYSGALEILKIPSMHQRRENLCLKFAKSLLGSSKFRDLLPKYRNYDKVLRKDINSKMAEGTCVRDRYYKSAIPYLIRLLNR